MKLTFQGCVEEEAPRTNEKVPREGNDENGVMTIPQTISDPFEGKAHKEKIREGVHELSCVDRRIVVLCDFSVRLL